MVFGLGNKFGHLGVLGTAPQPPSGYQFVTDTSGNKATDTSNNNALQRTG